MTVFGFTSECSVFGSSKLEVSSPLSPTIGAIYYECKVDRITVYHSPQRVRVGANLGEKGYGSQGEEGCNVFVVGGWLFSSFLSSEVRYDVS